MKDKRLYDLINEAMLKEIHTSYFYFDLETQCLNVGDAELSKQMHVCSKKHSQYALNIRDSILNERGLPLTKAIEQGREKKFNDSEEIIKAAIRKEKEVSRMYKEILTYLQTTQFFLLFDDVKEVYKRQNQILIETERLG